MAAPAVFIAAGLLVSAGTVLVSVSVVVATRPSLPVVTMTATEVVWMTEVTETVLVSVTVLVSTAVVWTAPAPPPTTVVVWYAQSVRRRYWSLPSSLSLSLYCLTQASHCGINVFALLAVQMHWRTADESSSIRLLESCCSLLGAILTAVVLATVGDGTDLCAHISALRGDVVEVEVSVLSSSEGRKGGDDGEL